MKKVFLLPLQLLLLGACGGAQTTPAPAATSAPTTAATTATASATSTSAPTAETPDPSVPHVKDVKVPAEIQAIADAPDRSPEDKALDAGRHPAETLAFFGVKPGWKVGEIASGGGYTTELLARAVGPNGKVWGVNNKFIIEKFAEKPWSARLAKPVDKNVVRVDREFDDPFPPDAKDLDAVFDVLFYHDTFWMKVDRDKMNRAIFAALKPGGVYAIIDHSGRAGTGANEVQTLHRIDEKVVKDEVLKAGFKLAEEGDFLRNPDDARDWNDSPGAAKERRGKSDRFVLKFVKP